uniref:Uncharacterized protein n=1 Tax=Arundo donax TaxID=35708 RepID=A0A0A9DF28_ARUDO
MKQRRGRAPGYTYIDHQPRPRYARPNLSKRRTESDNKIWLREKNGTWNRNCHCESPKCLLCLRPSN